MLKFILTRRPTNDRPRQRKFHPRPITRFNRNFMQLNPPSSLINSFHCSPHPLPGKNLIIPRPKLARRPQQSNVYRSTPFHQRMHTKYNRTTNRPTRFVTNRIRTIVKRHHPIPNNFNPAIVRPPNRFLKFINSRPRLVPLQFQSRKRSRTATSKYHPNKQDRSESHDNIIASTQQRREREFSSSSNYISESLRRFSTLFFT